MNYFKNIELANKYNISEATVRNWIKLSRRGNNPGLTLEHKNNRTYVANNPGNILIIERLVAKNKKYRNSKASKAISPQAEFYRVFTQGQIYDIARNLELHHEIPRQYNYFDGGAEKWDQYVAHLAEEKEPNLLNSTTNLILEHEGFLDRRLAGYDIVNVVDIGVGNAMPAKNLLQHLLDKGVLGRYIAIDISQTMLDIARSNVKQWFGNKVSFEGLLMDITHERFANILAEDYLGKNKRATNLLLFLGGTPYNFRNPEDSFRTINESMNVNDLLIYTDKLESPGMRPQWLNYEPPNIKSLAPRHRLVFDLLNIDESFYEVFVGYDAATRQRFARAELKVSLNMRFEFENGERILSFEKGDSILIWRSWEITAEDVAKQFKDTGYYVVLSAQTEDREYIMTVAEADRSMLTK